MSSVPAEVEAKSLSKPRVFGVKMKAAISFVFSLDINLIYENSLQSSIVLQIILLG